ncbi:hypothetical protein EPK99_25030 [Neorhizobium lilium]|uniref:Uncharacterized protein n=1 Tax=Neorhizobium lilium TaxID=2503024 RepID=A0A444LA44_9HYPH|nr:hypothetical protein [Neorhizobium lilium]RWX74451.1 hypothetical protein EPK99_25030 [Neorhizobium lilium]
MSDRSPSDIQHSASVERAAMWLADEQSPPQPIIPELRQRFALSALEASEACAMAQRFRIYRGAHG